jgi:glycosyltransferase involved in cell wall biosynthesis
VGGTAEILPRSDFAELLAPAGDPAALAAAAQGLLDDSHRRSNLSARLRQRAETAFDARAAAARLVGHYGDLLT